MELIGFGLPEGGRQDIDPAAQSDQIPLPAPAADLDPVRCGGRDTGKKNFRLDDGQVSEGD